MMYHRKDANHTMIVEYLEAAGMVWVDCTGDPLIGFDGLACGFGKVFPVEIKDGDKPPSAQKLTEGEYKRALQLGNVGVVIWILKDDDDCERLLEWARND